ncbi:hypothetical protein ACX80O_15360 [Arthrobacter sp. Hz1]
MPPLDPENIPPDLPGLEWYIACPDGTLISGVYIKWQGSYYSGYSIGTDMWIEDRVKGDLPWEWIPIPGTFHEGSERSSFRRYIPMDEVERFVSLRSTGIWKGLEFEVIAYSEDGIVAVHGGYSPVMIELLKSGCAPQLEVLESGRAGVIGDLPWAEMSNFRTEMTDVPLPKA